MYRGFRKGWDIISGGPATEGGIYKSTDGGETWTKLGDGLPATADRQDRHRHRAQPAQRRLRDGRGAGRRRAGSIGPTTAAPRGRSSTTRRTPRAPVLLQLRRRQSEEPERGLGQRARASTSTDGGKTFTTVSHAARRQPRHLVQPRQPESLHPVQRRRRQRHADGGRTWSSSSTSRPPSSTWSRVDEQIPIALRSAAGQHHRRRAERADRVVRASIIRRRRGRRRRAARPAGSGRRPTAR